MQTITEDRIKSDGIASLDTILKDEEVHVTKDNANKYVILSEEKYKEIIRLAFVNETLESYNDIKKGDYKKGNSKDLFKDLGI